MLPHWWAQSLNDAHLEVCFWPFACVRGVYVVWLTALTSWVAGRVTIGGHWELKRVLYLPTFAKSLVPALYAVASSLGQERVPASLTEPLDHSYHGWKIPCGQSLDAEWHFPLSSSMACGQWWLLCH